MNILIFGVNGRMRREKVEVIAGSVNQVSPTEAYVVEHDRLALEIRRPLFGFNPLGIFPPKKTIVLTAVANDGIPLLLSAGAAKHYRGENLDEKAQGQRLRKVNELSAQLAEHEAEIGGQGGQWDTQLSFLIYIMMAVFVLCLLALASPKIMETWAKYLGN